MMTCCQIKARKVVIVMGLYHFFYSANLFQIRLGVYIELVITEVYQMSFEENRFKNHYQELYFQWCHILTRVETVPS